MNTNEVIERLNKAYFSTSPDEEVVLSEFSKLIKGRTGVVVDIGASLGQFTKVASEVLTGAKIIAIEADPLRHSVLLENCAKWATEGRGNHLSALLAAVSNASGTVQFNVTNSCVSGGLTTHALDHLDPALRNEVKWTTVEVPSVTLDEMFPDAPPDFIKMDIEGAEYLALEGATNILKKGKTDWLIELHEFDANDVLPTKKRVLVEMRNAGYKGIEIAENRYIFTQSPWCLCPKLAFIGAAKAPVRALKSWVKRGLKGRR